MSDLLLLAAHLRALSDDQLRSILRQRQVSLQSKDFFELAEQLLSPKSIEAAVCKLTFGEAAAMGALLEKSTGDGSNAGASEQFENLALIHALAVHQNSKLKVLNTVAEVVGKEFNERLANAPESILRPASEATIDRDSLDALAAISAFEFQLGLTELVLDLEQRAIKLVGKNGVSMADHKRLAAQLRKPIEIAKGIYQFAESLHLIEVRDARWTLSVTAQNWLQLEIVDRWKLCVAAWIDSLSITAGTELASFFELHAEAKLSQALEHVFVLADKNLQGQLRHLVILAEWCGLAVQDHPTNLLLDVLNERFEKAEATLVRHLPRQVSELIIQADQTIIAPGPLPTAIEVQLRQFVELEQVSVATSYRLTALSITHGLEVGLTETQIRQLLTNLSSKPLPQPVDYLLRETAARFGRLTIASGTSVDRSLIKSSEGILLTEILNDSRLRPYGLKPLTAQTLSSRFEPEVLYFGLRENGYLAVRVNADGKVISDLANSAQVSRADLRVDKITAFIQELRNSDQRIGSQPNDDDLLRQLQLAIKNKTELTIEIQLRDSSTARYRMMPKSLANGRLRGLDAKADAERVLPLAQITRIEF